MKSFFRSLFDDERPRLAEAFHAVKNVFLFASLTVQKSVAQIAVLLNARRTDEARKHFGRRLPFPA
ncbi:hypothetical protein SD70_25435 [Gordoniibacillus kamchatkensis]|uniref:Transposase n=1 Tax=Gordoniibacillus kamchatkensis TaxID=1590651 RepID=A0ABR5ADA4_9BACL|nr:hypothetical protein SD70_25435 [Paenibacillus sp. VKM B-2647]